VANIGAKAERTLRARERERKILQLRLSGATFDTIGQQLGVSVVAAFKGYRRALAAVPAPEAAQERKAGLERIERQEMVLNLKIAALQTQESTPQTCDTIAHLSLAVWRWEQRRAALLGLDAPRQVQLETSSRLNAHELTQLTDLLDQRDSQQREASQAPAIETTATTAPDVAEPPEAQRQLDFTPLDAAVDQLDAAESE
jgi:hypothetical protein